MTEGIELQAEDGAQGAPKEEPKEEPREVGEKVAESFRPPKGPKRVEDATVAPEAVVEREGDYELSKSIEKAFSEVVAAASDGPPKDTDPAAIIESDDSPKGMDVPEKDDQVAIGTWPTPDRPEPEVRPQDGVMIDTVPLPEKPTDGSADSGSPHGDVMIDTVPLPEKPVPEEMVRVEGSGDLDPAMVIDSNDSRTRDSQFQPISGGVGGDDSSLPADLGDDRSSPITLEKAVAGAESDKASMSADDLMIEFFQEQVMSEWFQVQMQNEEHILTRYRDLINAMMDMIKSQGEINDTNINNTTNLIFGGTGPADGEGHTHGPGPRPRRWRQRDGSGDGEGPRHGHGPRPGRWRDPPNEEP